MKITWYPSHLISISFHSGLSSLIQISCGLFRVGMKETRPSFRKRMVRVSELLCLSLILRILSHFRIEEKCLPPRRGYNSTFHFSFPRTTHIRTVRYLHSPLAPCDEREALHSFFSLSLSTWRHDSLSSRT